MDEKKFRSLMRMAGSFYKLDPDRSDYWRGFQRGLRRLYHGEKFGTAEDHQKRMTCRNGDYRRDLQTGYRAGFYFEQLQVDDLRELRKLLDWSVADLAEIAAVSPRTVEGWEQGRTISEPIRQLIRKYLMI